VDGEVDVFCDTQAGTSAFGATLPIGTTTVTCGARDARGNAAAPVTFTVEVNDVTTPGEMRGDGFIRKDDDRYKFEFDVRERASGSERGKVSVEVNYGKSASHDDDDHRKKSDKGDKDDKKGKKDKDDDRDDKRGKKDEKREDDRFRSTAVTFVAFSDDPSIRPGKGKKARPQIDTVRFSGVGVWNGQAGYTFEVLATDQGEGRRHSESIAIVIRDASGQAVAEVSGELDGGNVQSKRIRH
jgi:hypothetical protein